VLVHVSDKAYGGLVFVLRLSHRDCFCRNLVDELSSNFYHAQDKRAWLIVMVGIR
jgi:hypothetical protein